MKEKYVNPRKNSFVNQLHKTIGYKHSGLTLLDCHEIMEIVRDTIKEALLKGEDVRIPEIGKIKLQYLKPRYIRNKLTKGVSKLTKPKYKVKFKPSGNLESQINEVMFNGETEE